ncbi:MAG TPA: hypothetical protein VM735_12340 [Candidatus Kapabacteria bacterium]|nr:hypothetical protein [Candidatus Kapabacteria bacterium]
MEPLFYALLIKDSTGKLEFAGAFQSRETAEKRGSESGKPYIVEAANL